jgi:hypothetical protein
LWWKKSIINLTKITIDFQVKEKKLRIKGIHIRKPVKTEPFNRKIRPFTRERLTLRKSVGHSFQIG